MHGDGGDGGGDGGGGGGGTLVKCPGVKQRSHTS